MDISNTQNLNFKWRYNYLVLLVASLFLGLTGCGDTCDVRNSYTYFEPIYTSMEEIRSSVDVLPARDLNAVGKIFFKDNFLFINEPNDGVHIIDNRDPANPVNIAFITIPGAFDLAIRGNTLYSDSYMDLVAIDITDLNNVTEIGREENFFNNYNSYGFHADPQFGVVTSWEEKEVIDIYESDCEGRRYDWGIYYEDGIALNDATNFSVTAAVAPSNPGIGGSMARFTLVNDYLYTIDMSELRAANVSNPEDILVGEKVHVGWGIETIFPTNDNLFIGAQDGMYIMELSNPLQPSQLSVYQHIRSCDPVIVDGDLAYVTLRSGTQCQGFTNQLEVIDVSDLTSPQLLHVYSMENPHGLAKDGNSLFVCDGSAGLKIFDAEDIAAIDQNQLAHYEGIQAYDVIAFNNIAMTIGEEGLFQYDYQNKNDIKFLSHIEIVKKDGQ